MSPSFCSVPSMKPLSEVQRLATSKSSSISSLNRVSQSAAAGDVAGDVHANPSHGVRSLSDTSQDAFSSSAAQTTRP